MKNTDTTFRYFKTDLGVQNGEVKQQFYPF